MPTYEYKCPECKHVVELFHGIADEAKFVCYHCFQNQKEIKMVKGFGGGSAIHFKGGGFYETDYKGK